jgi:hypothetical protein
VERKEGEKKREKGDDERRRDHHHRLAAHLISPHVSLSRRPPRGRESCWSCSLKFATPLVSASGVVGQVDC